MTPRIEAQPGPDGAAGCAASSPPPNDGTLADRLGDEIAECAALADAAMHTTLTRLREFLELELWSEHGALSAVQWCSWRLGWPRSTAKAKVRVALALKHLPLIDDAFRRGEISYSMVRALVRIATPALEATLLAYARETTANLMARIVRSTVQLLKQSENPDVSHHLALCFQNRGDGTVRLAGSVLPEQADTFLKAIDLKLQRDRAVVKPDAPALLPPSAADAESDDPDQRALSALLQQADDGVLAHAPAAPIPVVDDAVVDDEPPPPEDELARHEWARRRAEENRRRAAELMQARVDALEGICAEFIQNNRPARVIPGTVDTLVIVDYATLARADRLPIGRCELSDGTPLLPETARRLTCDAPFSPVLVGPDGSPLDVGRRTRKISPALWRALILRDRHCTFPGCERGGTCLNAHHMKHWAQGGETNLDNLTLTCRAHHRVVHEGGFSVVRLDAKTVVYFDPRGRPVGSSLRPAIEGDVLERLRERARAMGIVLDKRPVRARVNGLREADMCATVGYLLENTPGTRWYRPRQEVAA